MLSVPSVCELLLVDVSSTRLYFYFGDVIELDKRPNLLCPCSDHDLVRVVIDAGVAFAPAPVAVKDEVCDGGNVTPPSSLSVR